MRIISTIQASTCFCLFYLLLPGISGIHETHAQNIATKSLNDLEIIRTRIRDSLMEKPIHDTVIPTLVNSLQDDGSWPDINYKDVSRTGFEHSRHLSNMVNMSRAFQQPSSEYYQDEQLKKSVNKAVDYWLENDFICDNWWWNQIGTPDRLVDVYLVMDDHISEESKKKAAPIIGRAHLDAWGARPGGDRIKIATILGKAALLNRDTATLEKVVGTINEEIHFAYQRGTPDDQRGLQTDFSFHHRKDRVTATLSYGLEYAAAFADWSAKVSATKYHFTENSMQLLVDFFLDGICKTTIHAKFPDPGAKNRSLSRPGTLKAYSAALPQQLLKATDYREDELREVIRVRNGKAEPDFNFNKFFWHTEYMSHQRPGFFASVRMFSSRNHTMEVPYNGEGLLNHHLGEGANFISLNGEEYVDIFPVWDWQKIPGTTVVQKPTLPSEKEVQKRGLTDFVGGVSDGRYGAAAFDLISPLDSLKARKAWFFFDDAYVCLGAGIQADQPLPVATTLNQCHLDGQVHYAKRKKSRKLSSGDHRLKKIRWIHHDSIAYIFPERQSVRLVNDTVSGSWKRISRQHDSSDEKVTEKLLKLWIDHGISPKAASYAYIVVPGISLNEVSVDDINSSLSILANTPELQAVKHNQLNISQLTFYSPASIQLADVGEFSTEQAGMIMLQESDKAIIKVSVSDPARNLEHFEFSINGSYRAADENVKLHQEGGRTLFTVELPQGQYAGQSVTFTLEKSL